MRKILLATTALVGVALGTAGVAHATAPATSPLTVTVGGYVDAIAGVAHEAQSSETAAATTLASDFGGSGTGAQSNATDFETEFKLNVDVLGKASNGIQYGANISLWNGPEVGNLWTGGGDSIELNSAYVWLSGAFGKAMFGDEHGASDLFVYAPTVGEGQTDGRYMDFVSPFVTARFMPSGIDNTEHSTKITYYTPKVGNENNKVQLGVSYAPQMYDYGSSVTKTSVPFSGTSGENFDYQNGPYSPYQDLLKGAVQYTGNFHPVNVTASAQILNGSAQNVTGNPLSALFAPAAGLTSGARFQDFTAWGVGTQVGFSGFTVGGSYNDMGRYNAVHGQNKAQQDWTLGGKYEMDKVSVGVSWLNGQGYDNLLAVPAAATTTETNYVGNFNAYSAGATYTWFPGLTTAVDGTFFNQDVDSVAGGHNDGYVFLVSQKLTF